MNPYVLLAAAILSELRGTTALKLSEGFTEPVPSVAGVHCVNVVSGMAAH